MHPSGPAETNEPYNHRVDWSQKPGFWDPYLVTQLCVPNILKNVYVKQKARFIDLDFNKKVELDTIPCDGVRIYESPIEIKSFILADVDKYISFPCKQSLLKIVHENPADALHFLLCYLRKRGPFIPWEMRDDTLSTDQRYIHTLCDNYFHKLPELDFLACLMIGNYLTHLLHVAYAHNMFWLADLLAKIWGPLFIRMDVKYNKVPPYSEKDLIDIPIILFRRMLNVSPWEKYKPFEDINRCINPSNSRNLYHKYQELADEIVKANTPPQEYKNNAGTAYYNEILAQGPYRDEVAQLSVSQREEFKRNTFKTDRPIQPDSCDVINFGGPKDHIFYHH